MHELYLLFYTILSLIILFICRKKSLIVDYKLEKHKRFSSKLKSNSIGGILLGIFFIFQFVFIKQDYYLLIFLISILIIGFMSDIKKLNSVGLRFFLQLIITIIFVAILDYQIQFTKINFFDELLANKFVNIFFVTFCLMVLINGGNFIDGLNGLLIKYFLVIYLVILFKFPGHSGLDKDFLINLILVLTFILFLNLAGYIYMGDSGAYLLSLFTGIYLINFSSNNIFISPYLIIVFLWYPCFELLFSIIRRYKKKFKSYKPDALHLHQYIYSFIKRRFNLLNDLVTHFITSLIINIYNLGIFVLSINYIYNSKVLIYILVMNMLIYLSLYVFLKKNSN